MNFNSITKTLCEPFCHLFVFDEDFPPPAASALLCVLAVRVRGVFAARLSSNMKRGKKSEDAAAAENDPDSGTE